MSKTEYKSRRSHRKSRYGCTKCKERRIKCDELTPRCSRCERMNLACQYPRKKDWIEVEVSRAYCMADRASPPGSCGHSPALSASSVPPFGMLDSPLRSPAAHALSPTEFELLRHYLEHTSRDLTVDSDDQYTLQVGIPHLACHSEPLMRSVLALAAVCKCCDIIHKPPVSSHDRSQVVLLLSLAHQYHLESMREIQATLHEPKNYDHVLANAAMMGMYGSGSHCARIWLVKTATVGDEVPCHLMPEQPQWMSLFRAVRLAYAGLLKETLQTDDMPQASPALEPLASHGHQYEHLPSSHARALPNHPLAPTMAATAGCALSKLYEKATIAPTCTNIDPEDLQACLAALSIFNTIVTATFPPTHHAPQPSTPPDPNDNHLPHLRADAMSFNPAASSPRLCLLSPWLRRYAASISSMTPSTLPRRTIMSFVHKVPTRYLGLIEDVMAFISSHPTEAPAAMLELSVTHQLALEIFSHWLVLVMLLDDVWWIGGIGAWELGRVLDAVRKDGRWSTEEYERDGEEWWPGAMWEIARLFGKHR
ncbi:hypothetical protein VTI74DRAFT_8312 [Chaetomium olivicolor]